MIGDHHHKPKVRGTQIAWDEVYHNSESRPNGPHIFNVGNSVRLYGSITTGVVLHRTALTADVRWSDGRITTIPQFSREVYVTDSRVMTVL